MKKILMLSPFILFLLMIALLWRGLFLHPTQIPSPLINEPAPHFQLPSLFDPHKIISNKNFIGHVTLLNVWATWCDACTEEHATLLKMARDDHQIIFGLDYKDDTTVAKNWLKMQGNPYQLVAIDEDGNAAIDWGDEFDKCDEIHLGASGCIKENIKV